VTPTCSGGAGDKYAPGAEYQNIAGNLDFYAQWETGNYTLTVNKTGAGIITSNPGNFICPSNAPTCTFTYPPSTLVTLTATTNPKKVYWSERECDSITGTQNEICTVTMNIDRVLTSLFL